MARWRFWYEWDFDTAEREFKRASELNPNYAEAHERYSSMLSCMGRYDEAVAEGDRALEIDPLSFGANLNVGWVFWCAGLYNRALDQGRKLIELDANFYGGYLLIGVEAWGRGEHDLAIAALEKAVSLGGGPLALSLLGSLLGVASKLDEARQALDRLRELNARQYVLRFYLAMIHAGMGENDRAFELFERAYEQRDGMLVMLKNLAGLLPRFSADPRLADLLRRIGLPH